MSTAAKFGFLALLLLGVATVAPIAVAADGDIVATAEGQIAEIDYASMTTIISGASYRFAIDAKVDIAGTFGAPTMLTSGMNVRFTYRQWDDGAREIIELAELPAGVEPVLH